MKTFIVEVARNATVRYRAKVQAESVDEITSQISRHGYRGEIQGEWEEYSVCAFDNVEEFTVLDENEIELYVKDMGE